MYIIKNVIMDLIIIIMINVAMNITVTATITITSIREGFAVLPPMVTHRSRAIEQ